MSARLLRARAATAAAVAATLLASCGGIRSSRERAADPLLQLEIADSVGLPLPDGRLELYTRVEGGLYREWVPVEPSVLREGIHLLRFSHPGYRSSVFSVPLRERGRVSLRVRLMADTGTRTPRTALRAASVHATGLAIRGRETTEIIGARRVLDRDAVDFTNAGNIGELLRRATDTGLLVEAGPAGLHQVSQLYGRTPRCGVQVIVNGDATMLLGFTRFETLYRLSEPEAIEIMPRATTLPYYFRRTDNDCTLLLVWLTGREM